MTDSLKKTVRMGTLYGVGVGPGDPELLTLKAQRILNEVGVIFSATSGKSTKSLALEIVKDILSPDQKIIPLHFPMTRNKGLLKRAWNENSDTVLGHLKKNIDVAFITLGDPSTYSTFTYLHRFISKKEPNAQIEIIPGITSFQAAAARLKIPLSEGEESLVIISGAKGERELKNVIDTCDNIVILKAYRHYDSILRLLEKRELIEKGFGARNIGLKDESLTTDIKKWDGKNPSYFTLLLVKKQNSKKKL